MKEFGPGDVDCDNDVDKDDILTVLISWLTSGTLENNYRENVNSDGKVNGMDFAHVIKDWNL